MRTWETDGVKCYGLDLSGDEAGLHLVVCCSSPLPSPWRCEHLMAGATFEARLHILTPENQVKNDLILGHAGCQHIAQMARLAGCPHVAEIFDKLCRAAAWPPQEAGIEAED